MHIGKDNQENMPKIEKLDVLAMIIAALEVVMPLALIMMGSMFLVLLFITKVIMK